MRGHGIAHGSDARMPRREAGHRIRERVPQPFCDLEQGQIRGRQAVARKKRRAGALQHPFEIPEKLRQAQLAEVRGTAQRLRLLLLVVEALRDRMMGVVGLHDEVGDHQQQLLHPAPPCVVVRHEAQPGAKVLQDVRRLEQHRLTVREDRRCERHTAAALQHPHDALPPAALGLRQPADVEVVRTAGFQREPDEFAAALDVGPVVKTVHAFLRKLLQLRSPRRAARPR
jgi:hypothetical protein